MKQQINSNTKNQGNQVNQANQGSDNVPKLRFPEFEGEWERKELGKVAEISSGGTPSRTNPSFWNGKVPWISTTLIDFNSIDKSEEYITQEGLKNSSAKIFPIGTLLMAMYGQGKTRGKIAILNIEAATNQACGAIITKSNILNSLFAFQNLSNRYDEIRDLSNQGGQENLSGGIIKGIGISFPTLPEQTRIASFLTSIDEKLQALKKKKALLEEYKIGVMQKLFSQELRFKDENGIEFPGWVEKKLGEICEKIQDGNYGGDYPKASEFIEKGIPFLTSKAIGQDGRIIKEKIDYISLEKHKQLKKAHLRINDVLFTNRGSNVGTIGLVTKNIAHGNIGPQLTLLRCSSEIYYSFLKEIMDSYIVQKQVNSQNSGSAMNFFGIGETSKFMVPLPSIKEQTKIANFLSSIDEKLKNTEKQIAQTNEWKNGLLQRMFV